MDAPARRRFAELQAGGLLPSPSGVAAAIVEAAGRPEAGIPEIVHLVQADPAMAGRLLRYANAAHGGARRPVASLAQAVAFLGLFRVRQVALSFSLLDGYRTGECEAFGYFRFWSTSLANGIAAQHLAARGLSPPDESFTCGLLAGIGRLGLATVFPKEYSRILETGIGGASLLAAERQAFGIDHAQLSGEMLVAWGLPDIFASAVRHHEFPADSPFSPDSRTYALTAVLHLAGRIGRLLNLEESRRWEWVPSLYSAAAPLGLEAGDLPPLVEAVATDWQAWGRELKLPLRSPGGLGSLFAVSGDGRDGGEEAGGTAAARQRVCLVMADSPQRAELAAALSAIGLRPEAVAGPAEVAVCREAGIFIVDLGEGGAAALDAVRSLRDELGDTAHVLALIGPAAEPQVAELLLAGASDYLCYDFSQPALVARLSVAQQMVSLRRAVRNEWHLAINSSGTWARANRRLLREALTDPLTQLPNRRHGLDRFDQEWAVAGSSGLPISCMMFDIDHFKRVNDQRGHDVGDLVLQQVAAVIERSCRRSDLLFRYGGEEFCCICPHTGLDDAVQLAWRIAGAVGLARYGRADDPFGLTISVGVACRVPAIATPADLIARADRALYDAKAQGRNRVVALPAE